MERFYLIPIVIIIGLISLFFFPEPETNFLAYFETMLFFGILTTISILWVAKEKK